MLYRKIILLVSLVILKCFNAYGEKEDFFKDCETENVTTKYDFIIVGAGPAGCVIANRLSENPNWKVLLLEAGGVENVQVSIPVTVASLVQTDYAWHYSTEPTSNACLGLNKQRCSAQRGKGVGGTSLINYMFYNRGNRRDFDRWAKAGNKGWSYNKVLPYFLKSEMANLEALENSPYHNHTGPLSVEFVRYKSKLGKGFVEASKEAGYNELDYNGKSQMGTSYLQTNTLYGRRHSAARAFIEPLYNARPNLVILTGAFVTKININPKTKIAYGVEFVRNNTLYKVRIWKEIILSAGVFHSPQLLILSGVGPKKHLKEINVPLIKNLPVGKLLWDHVTHIGPIFIANTTGESIHGQNLYDPAVAAEFAQGKGKMTSVGGGEALTFFKAPGSTEPASVTDVEIVLASVTFASDGNTNQTPNFLTEENYNIYKPLEPVNIDAFTTLCMLFHPKSKGYLKLKDNNPFNRPLLYPNYLSEEEDVETLLSGIREAIRITEQPAMQKLGAHLYDIPLPRCVNYTFNSDDYWRCSIRTLSDAGHHQVGTCKMGPKSDRTSVVSDELKVHGIKRLRVADTSIIPEVTTSHTNAGSYMIGEKAADMIRGDWH